MLNLGVSENVYSNFLGAIFDPWFFFIPGMPVCSTSGGCLLPRTSNSSTRRAPDPVLSFESDQGHQTRAVCPEEHGEACRAPAVLDVFLGIPSGND